MSYTDYMMPFGWGESDKPNAGRKQHPIVKLQINQFYKPIDQNDKDIAQCTATRLRKRGIMDVKYKNGVFTRVK